MGGIAIHYLAKTKLGIKTYENLSELHTQTNVPSCIKSVVIQSVITECVYFVITINMDASNGCVTIEFSLTTYSASQIRACRDDKVGVICNIYNPQIQISAESETKRSIFREKDKTKRSKKESAQHSKSRNKSFVMTSVSAL